MTPFTSLTKQDPGLQICPDCTALVYRLRDAIKANAEESVAILEEELSRRQKKGGMNVAFSNWKTTWLNGLSDKS